MKQDAVLTPRGFGEVERRNALVAPRTSATNSSTRTRRAFVFVFAPAAGIVHARLSGRGSACSALVTSRRARARVRSRAFDPRSHEHPRARLPSSCTAPSPSPLRNRRRHLHATLAQRGEPRLRAQSLDVRAAEFILRRRTLQLHVIREVHASRVDAEDVSLGLDVREAELDLSVDGPGRSNAGPATRCCSSP